ncbi:MULTISPECIES: hypothetical protein [unclassified Xanthomonas]|uniref:hypothetical protein n=1 Tax=Xanthomonas sp. LMG 8992 TaxID=1591157 RepID=UPI00183D23D3|nr:hypothetical protein [Xanthomonas sp. LMG 8992]
MVTVDLILGALHHLAMLLIAALVAGWSLLRWTAPGWRGWFAPTPVTRWPHC